MSVVNGDIFEQLKSEHREVQSLFEEMEGAEIRKRLKLLADIEARLVPHSRAEEKTLYALLYERQEGDSNREAGQINEAYAEHAAVDKLLKELKQLDPTNEAWLGKLKVIKENVEHHVEEEENEIFKLAKKTLNDNEQDELLKAYLKVKEEFKESLPTQAQISERTQDKQLQAAIG